MEDFVMCMGTIALVMIAATICFTANSFILVNKEETDEN